MLSEIQVELHRSGLGGSDGAAVLGVHPNRSAMDVYLEKRGLKPAFEGNRFTKWGNKLEAVVAEAYAEETGRDVFMPEEATFATGIIKEHGFMVHPGHPFIVGFPDRLIMDKEKGPGVLEIKNTSSWKAKEWEQEAPLQHQVQHQHYLLLTGFEWGSIAALIGGNDHRFMDVEANHRFQSGYVQSLVTFWEQHVLPGVPPEVDPNKDAENLRYVFSAVAEGTVAELGPEIEELAERFEALKDQIKGLEAQKKEAETYIKSHIGTAEAARFPAGWGYTWKQSERAGYTVASTVVRTLRLVKKF